LLHVTRSPISRFPNQQKPSHLLFFGSIWNALFPRWASLGSGHGNSQISYAKFLEPLIFTVGHLKGDRLSGWGDQTLENPYFFLLWNDCIYSAYKLSPSFFMYLWHFFGTFPHLHQWIIGQFCKELFETTWRWSPLQRGPTKLLMRSRWRETRLLEDLTFNSQFSLTFPKWKKLGKIEKIKRPLK